MPEDDIPERPEIPSYTRQRYSRYMRSKRIIELADSEERTGWRLIAGFICFIIVATMFSLGAVTYTWPGWVVLATVQWGVVVLEAIIFLIYAATSTPAKDLGAAKQFVEEYDEYELGDYQRLKLKIAEWDLEYG